MKIFQMGSKHGTKHPSTNYQLLFLLYQPIQPALGYFFLNAEEVGNIRKAVTWGWSIQGSMIKGPTLFTMTIVLLFCFQVSLPMDGDVGASGPPSWHCCKCSPGVEENHLHLVIRAPTDGELFFFLGCRPWNWQPHWLIVVQEKRRGEIGSVICILVRAFFLPLTAIHDDQHLTGFHNAVSRILKTTPPADSAKSTYDGCT